MIEEVVYGFDSISVGDVAEFLDDDLLSRGVSTIKSLGVEWEFVHEKPISLKGVRVLTLRKASE